ncbi:hypothetical protein D3C87_348120 [compost metagenome]
MDANTFTVIAANGQQPNCSAIVQWHTANPLLHAVIEEDLKDCKKDLDFIELFCWDMPPSSLFKLTVKIDNWPTERQAATYLLVSKEALSLEPLALMQQDPAQSS